MLSPFLPLARSADAPCLAYSVSTEALPDAVRPGKVRSIVQHPPAGRHWVGNAEIGAPRSKARGPWVDLVPSEPYGKKDLKKKVLKKNHNSPSLACC
jgi:hypothetical protein